TLKQRRAMIKGKTSVAKTQKTINDATGNITQSENAIGNLERMAENANRTLDETTAMTELNTEPTDEAKALEETYASNTSAAVEDELSRLKLQMGLDSTDTES